MIQSRLIVTSRGIDTMIVIKTEISMSLGE